MLTRWSELAREPASDEEGAHSRARIAHCLFGFAFLDDLLDSPAFPAESVDPHVLASRSTGCHRATPRAFVFGANGVDLNVAAVPEPETYAMLLAGLGAMGWAARRKKRALRA